MSRFFLFLRVEEVNFLVMIIPTAEVINRVDEYFFSSKLRMIADMKKQGKPVINLGIGSPDGSPAQEVLDEFIYTVKNENAHGYQAYKGNPDFLSALAGWYSEHFKVELNSLENVLPLAGSKEGLSFILHAFINPGDEVLVPNPGYPTYTSASLLHYAEVKYYNLMPERNYQPDFDELQKLVSDRTKILFLNYPHMPTGMPATVELYQKFVDFAHNHKILLVNDNPYVFLHEKQISIFNAQGAFDVAIELNSLSKSHNLAGWRIGMAVAKKEYIDILLKMRSNMNSGHFLPFQAAAIKALSLPEKWYEQQRVHYNSRRRVVNDSLHKMGFHIPEGQAGMFVWAKIPDRFESGEQLADLLLENTYVFVTNGILFGSQGDKFIRISLCSNKNVLKEALTRIENFLKNY